MKQFGNLTMENSAINPNYGISKSKRYFCFSKTIAVRAGMYNRR